MAIRISSQLKKQGVAVRAGEGGWAKWDGMDGDVVVAFVKSDEHPGEGWSPLYPASRVNGDSYQPYHSRTEWAEFANRSMAEDANSNFRRRSMH